MSAAAEERKAARKQADNTRRANQKRKREGK